MDPVARLQKFREKYDLGFHFASDVDRSIGVAYGTLKGDLTTSHERDTVLVGADGVIKLAYRRVKAAGHAAQVLADTRGLRDAGAL